MVNNGLTNKNKIEGGCLKSQILANLFDLRGGKIYKYFMYFITLTFNFIYIRCIDVLYALSLVMRGQVHEKCSLLMWQNQNFNMRGEVLNF